MNFKQLILSSFIIAILNSSCMYATDAIDNIDSDISTSLENEFENAVKNNNNGSNGSFFTSSSIASINMNGNISSFSQQSNYSESTDNNGKKTVTTKNAREITNKINGKTFRESSNANNYSEYNNNTLVHSTKSRNTHLRDDNNEQNSNFNNVYNKDGDSSIDSQLYENGKLTNDFHEIYKNNNDDMQKYESKKKEINEDNKRSYGKFVNRYLKNTGLTDKEIAQYKNNGENIRNLLLGNTEKLDNKSDRKALPQYSNNKNRECYGDDCYSENNKNNSSINRSQSLNKKSYNEDIEDFKYNTSNTKYKTSSTLNINELDELQNNLEYTDNIKEPNTKQSELISPLKNTVYEYDNNVDIKDSKSYLNRYSPDVKTKFAPENIDKSKLRRNNSMQDKTKLSISKDD